MTELKFISPHTTKEEKYQDYINWNGVYFHGSLETYVNTTTNYKYPGDLVVGNKYSWNYKEGIYEVFCYSKPARLYLWRFNVSTQDEYKLLRGLIVDPTSVEDIKYAEEHFNFRSKSL